MQSFTVGQEVAILDYEDRRSGRKTYDTGWFVTGRFDKYGTSYRVRMERNPRGRYVGIKRADTTRDCGHCNGTGFVLPEGFDPEGKTEAHIAYYRQPCLGGSGYRCINGQVTHIGNSKHVIDRSDKIMSMEAYAPILAAKLAAAEAQKQANRIRLQRVRGMVGDLIQTVNSAQHDAEQPDNNVNVELAVARFLKTNWHLLGEAYVKVIDDARPVCVAEGCTSKVAYDGDTKCYSHKYN